MDSFHLARRYFRLSPDSILSSIHSEMSPEDLVKLTMAACYINRPQDRQARYRASRRSRGLCLSCPNPSPSSYCPDCARKRSKSKPRKNLPDL